MLGKIVVGAYANNLGKDAIAERALDLIDAGVLVHALGIEDLLDLHARSPGPLRPQQFGAGAARGCPLGLSGAVKCRPSNWSSAG